MTPDLALATWLGLAQVGPTDVRPALEPLPTRHDGVYGRFDHALDAGFGAGASHLAEATRLELRGSLHYFSMAGVFLGGGVPLAHGDGAVIAFGADVRPGFVPRWSEGMQQGPALLDLFIDSISLSLGPYFQLPGDTRAARGLELGLGAGLPLNAHAHGPWLEARALARVPDREERTGWGAMLLLSWHEGFGEPPAP